MPERSKDHWLYAVLRELAGVRGRRHSLWAYLQVRAVETLTRLEHVPRPGWR